MKIDCFYKLNICPSCSNKCNREPYIIHTIIKKPEQEITNCYKCKSFFRADK